MMASSSGLLGAHNTSDFLLLCSINQHDPHVGNSCYLTQPEMGERDCIAVIRVIASCFSLMGAASIIVSAIGRKQVFNPKIHPIFVLSLVDCMLAVLYIIGGLLWLRRFKVSGQAWCYFISLLTIILQCVAVNLILVYALLAYSGIKKKDFANILHNSAEDQVWTPLRIAIAYLLALGIPTVVIMLLFGIVAGMYMIVTNADACSCWCYPVSVGNVLPFAVPRDWPTANYVHYMSIFRFSYDVVVGTHYLVVFVLLVVIYYKILKRIKRIRVLHENNHDLYNYGTTKALIVQGQSKARKRVFLFLSVFIIAGFFNVFLAFFFMVYEGQNLPEGPVLYDKITEYKRRSSVHYKVYLTAFILQSITVPLQGFMNAIVYGWTKEDFLDAMAVRDQEEEASSDDGRGEEDSVTRTNTLTSSTASACAI